MTVFLFANKDLARDQTAETWFAVGRNNFKKNYPFDVALSLCEHDDPVPIRRWLERNIEGDAVLVTRVDPFRHCMLHFEKQEDAAHFMVGCPNATDIVLTREQIE